MLEKLVILPQISGKACRARHTEDWFSAHFRKDKKKLTRTTEVSHSNGPFVFQPGHLILTNSFSKEVINPADISTPKIWDQSDNWFKSYGQKVNFLLTES